MTRHRFTAHALVSDTTEPLLAQHAPASSTPAAQDTRSAGRAEWKKTPS